MRLVTSHLYAEYGRYIDTLRAIPKDIDCLKLVERRLLLTLHQSARTKLEKSAKVVGLCLAYHPHGDKSTYDALVNLVNRKFADGKGNWGQKGWDDSSAASMRYTECKANAALDSAFSQYLDFIPWEVIENEKEPLYLPFPIPIGLIGSGLTLGIGFHRTLVPRYKPNDLAKRLYELLTNQPLTTIKPNIDGCDVYENSNGEFENILTTGKGSIIIEANHIRKSNEILITGMSPISKFNKLKALNASYEADHGVQLFSFLDLWNAECKTPTKVEIKPYSPSERKKPIDQAFYDLIASRLRSVEHITTYVVDSDLNVVRLKSIDELLLLSFKKWKEAKLKSLQNDYNKLIANIEELKVVKLIQETYINNTNVKTVNDLIKIIKSDPNVKFDESTIQSIANRYSITKLIEWNINIKPLQSEANEKMKMINDIDNVSINHLKSMFRL